MQTYACCLPLIGDLITAHCVEATNCLDTVSWLYFDRRVKPKIKKNICKKKISLSATTALQVNLAIV